MQFSPYLHLCPVRLHEIHWKSFSESFAKHLRNGFPHYVLQNERTLKKMTQLSIASPCSEQWSDMPPVRRDCRFCAVCDKQIVDFTQKTDAEILAYLQNGQGKVCGRFKEEQLERPLVLSKTPHRSGLTAVAASFAAVLAAQQPVASQSTAPISTEQTPVDVDRYTLGNVQRYNYLEEQDSMRIISGKVIDEERKTGLPGVNVMLGNSGYGAVTDKNGAFSFEAPNALVMQDTTQLRFYYLGYEEKLATLPERAKEEDIAMEYSMRSDFAIVDCKVPLVEQERTMMGGVQLSKPSLGQRIGRFFKDLLPKKKRKKS